jgi:hypothetical protein
VNPKDTNVDDYYAKSPAKDQQSSDASKVPAKFKVKLKKPEDSIPPATTQSPTSPAHTQHPAQPSKKEVGPSIIFDAPKPAALPNTGYTTHAAPPSRPHSNTPRPNTGGGYRGPSSNGGQNRPSNGQNGGYRGPSSNGQNGGYRPSNGQGGSNQPPRPSNAFARPLPTSPQRVPDKNKAKEKQYLEKR